jgi:hypothetical protein
MKKREAIYLRKAQEDIDDITYYILKVYSLIAFGKQFVLHF